MQHSTGHPLLKRSTLIVISIEPEMNYTTIIKYKSWNSTVRILLIRWYCSLLQISIAVHLLKHPCVL